jgi:hypothetical protein
VVSLSGLGGVEDLGHGRECAIGDGDGHGSSSLLGRPLTFTP